MIVLCFKKIGYSKHSMRPTACMIVNPIMVDDFASVFNSTSVSQSAG